MMGVPGEAAPRRGPGSAEERVESLISAAAAVADDVGVERLTTTLVAQWSGASIGTVYRYFPDRIGVIDGVRRRNARILHDRMHDALDVRVDDWAGAVEVVAQALADAYREVPGFRAVTSSDWLDDDESTTLACIERLARAAVPHGRSQRRATLPTQRLRAAMRILDALTRSAFGTRGDGDPELLELGLRHARDEVQRPVGASSAIASRGGGEALG